MTSVFENKNGMAPSILDLASTLENLEARKILEKKLILYSAFKSQELSPSGMVIHLPWCSLNSLNLLNLLSIFHFFQDSELTKEEIIAKHDVFVGSQATDFGEALTRHDEF